MKVHNILYLALLIAGISSAASQSDVKNKQWDTTERLLKRTQNSKIGWRLDKDGYSYLSQRSDSNSYRETIRLHINAGIVIQEMTPHMIYSHEAVNSIKKEYCTENKAQHCKELTKSAPEPYKLSEKSVKLAEDFKKNYKKFTGKELKLNKWEEASKELAAFNKEYGKNLSGIGKASDFLSGLSDKGILNIKPKDMALLQDISRYAKAGESLLNAAVGIAAGNPAGYIQAAMTLGSVFKKSKPKGPSRDEIMFKAISQILQNQKIVIESLQEIDRKIVNVHEDLKQDLYTISWQVEDLRDLIISQNDKDLERCGTLKYAHLQHDDIKNTFNAWNPIAYPVEKKRYHDLLKYIEDSKQRINEVDECITGLEHFYRGDVKSGYVISPFYRVSSVITSLSDRKSNKHNKLSSIKEGVLARRAYFDSIIKLLESSLGDSINQYNYGFKQYVAYSGTISNNFDTFYSAHDAWRDEDSNDITYSLNASNLYDTFKQYMSNGIIWKDTRDIHATIPLIWDYKFSKNKITNAMDEKDDIRAINRLLSSLSLNRLALAQENMLSGISMAPIFDHILNDKSDITSKDKANMVAEAYELLYKSKTARQNFFRYLIWKHQKTGSGNDWFIVVKMTNGLHGERAYQTVLGEQFDFREFKSMDASNKKKGADIYRWKIGMWCPATQDDLRNDQMSLIDADVYGENKKYKKCWYELPTISAIDSYTYLTNPISDNLKKNIVSMGHLASTIKLSTGTDIFDNYK